MEVNIENEMVNLVFKNQGKQKWSKKIFFKIVINDWRFSEIFLINN